VTFDIDEACAAARTRVHARVDVMHYDACKQTAILAESARRSIGQKVRYWQEQRRALHRSPFDIRAAQDELNGRRARMIAQLTLRHAYIVRASRLPSAEAMARRVADA